MRHKKCLLVLLMVFILSAIIPMAVMAGAEDSLTVTVDPTSVVYDGTVKNPALTVKDGAVTLSEGTDYTVEWKNAAGNTVTELKDASKYTAVVVGKGNYAGKSGEGKYTIARSNIAFFEVDIAPQIYTGFPIIPESIEFQDQFFEVVHGVTYSISSISNNTNVGTASINLSGTGNFIGSANGNFLINPASFSNVQITVDKTLLIIEDGQFVPEITSIKLGEYALAANDYVVSYEDAEGTELSTAPTAAGSYKLVVAPGTSGSFNGDAQKIAFEIKAAVAKIGDKRYASFEDAIAAANEMTGEVTIDLLDDVTWTTGASHGSTPFLTADSAVTSLTINGNAHKLTAVGQGIGSIRAANNGVLNFNNMTIKDESKSYAEGSWEHGYLEFGGKLNFADVDFVNAIMITRDNGHQENCESTFTNCTFNSNAANEYDIWVSQGDATFNNCEFTGYRGAKTHEAYSSEVGTLTFNQCSFKNLSVKPGLAVGTVNTNTTVIFDTCTFENVQAGDQGWYILESDTEITDYNLIFRGTQLVDGKDAIVARIDGRGFITIDSAFAAVKDGDTLFEILKAGDYTLPSSLPNITLQGNVAGVKFTHTSGGNISAISNGITFKNLTFNFGNVDYHGFQHAGTINMVGCTLNGKFFSYSDMNFTDCTFNASGVEASGVSSEDYSMWAYAGNLTYTNCTFNGAGKFINVYNEDGTTRYTITATGCTFNSTKSNKAAFNVKETCGTKVLQFTVNLNNNTINANFPAASGTLNDKLMVFSGLVQVDDRVIGGTLNGGEIVVNVDGEQVYITPKMTRVAKIGTEEYVSLVDAFAAAQSGDTVEIIVSEVELPATAVIPAGVTLKGNGTDKTTVKITTTSGSGIKITNLNVTIKDLAIDGSAITSSGYNTLINVRADGCVIDNVVFSGGGTSTWNSSILVETLPATATFTVKNSKITGSFRGVLRESCSANIVIENCDIDAVYPFNIDCGSGGTVTVTGSKLHGWTSYSSVEKVTFTNCEFSKGNSGYDIVAAYVDTEFNNCTFDSSFEIYARTSPFTFTLEDCKKGNTDLTFTNFTENFSDSDVWIKCDTYVNGHLVGAVAMIGDEENYTEFKTLQEAVNAAHSMDGNVTVTLLTDTVENVWIHQKLGLNLTITGDSQNKPTVKGNLIIDGDGDFSATRTDTLTIENLKVVKDADTSLKYTNALIIFPKTTGDTESQTFIGNHNNYAHHVTIQSCEFDANGDMGVAAIRSTTGGGCFNGATFSNLIAANMHSLAQLQASSDFHFINCSATNVKNGINISGGNGNGSISGCTIEATGYAVRFGTTSAGGKVTLSNNVFSSTGTDNDEGAVVTRNSSGTNASTVLIEDGFYTGKINASDTNKLIVVTGGYFTVAPEVQICGKDSEGNQLYPMDNTDEETSDDYPYTVGSPVAVVNDFGYQTVADAKAARTGNDDVITLLKSASYDFVAGDVLKVYKVNGDIAFTYTVPEGQVLNISDPDTNGVVTYSVVGAVARIGNVLYASIDEAVAAANTDDVIEVIVAGTYTLPNLPKKVTIKGDVDGVVFSHTTAGSVASIPNGATFENVTFNFGNVDYNGFQHAGTINMDKCIINGRLSSYGDMNFTECTFNAPGSEASGITGKDYSMWAYSGDITYTDCTFNGAGKFIHLYNESGAVKYTVTASGCKFISSASDKAAFNVKETCEGNGNALQYDLIISDCTTEGDFPESKETNTLVVGNDLWQVDKRLPNGAEPKVAVYLDGEQVYPVYKVSVSDGTTTTKFISLQNALNAAHEMTGNVTVTLLKDITEVAVIHQKAGLNLTVDGDGKTITGQLYIDGDGRYNDADTLTIQNVKFAYDATTYDDAFIDVPSTKTTGKPYTTGKYNYAHNITVKNCEFAGSGETTVAFRVASNAGANKVTLEGNTVTNGHSFAQLVGVKDLTITDNTVTGTKNGINISGGDGTGTISGNTLTAQGYTVRVKDNSGMNVTLSENTFSGEEGIVNESKNSVTTFIVSGFYDGHFTTGNAGKIEITGGYFVEVPAFEYCGKDTNGNQLYPILNEDEATKEAYPYTVGTAVAAVENLAYGIFTDAVVAANNGEKVIMLLANIAEPYTLSAEETLKVAHEGKTLTVKAPEGYVLKPTEADGVTTYTVKKAVAKIGDTLYASLKDAVAAVTDNTATTITMIDNEAIDVVGSAITINAGRNITIDLNGFQVVGTAGQGSTSALITNKGTLTIKDSSADGTGKLISGATNTWIYNGDGNYAGSYASNTITNSGTLTIESGWIENLSTGSATYAIDNNSSGGNAIANITGGTVKAHSVAIREFANSASFENTVNISGGTVTAGYSGIWIQLPGSDASKAMKAALNVTGGTITGGSYAFYDYTYGNSFDNTLYTLSGGTFNGVIFSYGANITITGGVYNGEVAIKQTKASNVSVSGGFFGGDDVYTYGANASEGFITGGYFATITYEYEGETYDCDWTYLLHPDYKYVANEEPDTKDAYPYKVVPKVYVAQIGETKYESVEEALAAANNDDVVVLLVDHEENATYSGDKTVALDLNGKVLTGTISFFGGDITVKNGTLNGRLNVYDASEVTLNADATVNGMAVVWGDGTYGAEGCKTPVFNVYGTINQTVEDGAITTNGTDMSGAVINVFDGAKVTSADIAVYLPSGNLNVKGGTITGKTAVYVKSGSLNISGGVIIGNGPKADYVFYGNGAYPTGDALVIENCDYPNGVPAVSISGGVFVSENGNAVGSYAIEGKEPVAKFMSGGIYSDNSDITRLGEPDNKILVKIEEGEYKDMYELGDSIDVTFDVNGGTPEIEPQKIAKGEKAVKPDDPTKTGKVFAGWTLNGEAYDFDTAVNASITLKATWSDAVARIGDVYYATLKDAVNAAQDGETVELLVDTTEENITINNKITVDLGGHRVISNNGTIFIVSAAGDMTLTGNGMLIGPVNGAKFDGKALINVSGGKLDFVNGTLNATGTGSDGMYGVYIYNGGTAVFGTADGNGPTINSHFAAIGTNNTTAPAHITVNGGAYTANAVPTNNESWYYFCAPIYAASAGEFNINGGTFNGYYGISDRYLNVDQDVMIKEGVKFLASSGIQVFVDEQTGAAGTADRHIKAEGNALTLPEGYIWKATETEGIYEVAKAVTVTFDVDGDTTVIEAQTIAVGDMATKPADPVKDGYTFIDWFEVDATEAFDFANTPVKANITLVARWYENVAKIGNKYYATLAEAVDAAQVGDKVELLKDASGAGIFLGTADAKNITIDLGGFTYTVTGPAVGSTGTENQAFHLEKGNTVVLMNGTVTSTADSGVWMLVQNYCNLTLENVTLDGSNMPGNGNYALSNNCGNVVIGNGTHIIANDGSYAFDVCATNYYPEGVTVTVAEGAVIDGDVQYDVWGTKPADNKATLVINGGTFNGTFDIEEALVEDAKTNIVINGGAFADDKGNECKVPDGQKLFKDDDNYYRLHEYFTVSFDTKDGTPAAIDAQEVIKGETAVKPVDPTKEGYRFDGWLLDGAEYDFDAAVTANIELEAKWTKLYTVKFVTEDGIAAPEAQKVADGEKATKPADPEKTGYTFKGWFTEGATEAFDFETAITADITLTARWEANKITVSFYPGNGDDPIFQTVDYNGKAKKPADPTKAGYVFAGWQLDGAAYDFETPVTAEIILRAVWTEAVAKIGDTYYATLKAAVRAAVDGDTVVLLKDTEESFWVPDVDKTITIDLGGNTFTGWLGIDDGPKVTIANGTLNGQIDIYGGTSTNHNSLTIAADAIINAPYGIVLREAYGTYGPKGYGSTIDINGTVNGIVWVMGNITEGDSVINVNNGAKISGDSVGIALNGVATVNVKEGAVVNGTETGIEVRAGTLNVTGGTITGGNGATEIDPNGNGTTTSGAGIAIAQHTTKCNISVNISGGTISGNTGLSIANPEGNSEGTIKVAVTGGVFNGPVTVADNETRVEKFVSGGDFSETVKPEYVVDGKLCTTTLTETINGKNYYYIVDAVKVTFVTEDGITAPEAQTIPAGEKAVKPADPQKNNYNFLGWFADGATEAFDFDTVITANTTLTAKWDIVTYTVTFDSNGGSDVEAQTVEHGDKATKPADPTKAGYVFAGWQLDGAAYDFETPVTAEIILRAVWTEAVASITKNNVTTYYASLRLAVAAAEAGDTIDLLRDDVVSFAAGGIVIDKNLTIDGHGYTVKGLAEYGVANVGSMGDVNDNNIHGFYIKGGNVTIKDLEMTQFGDSDYVNKFGMVPVLTSTDYTGTLTLENVDINKFNRQAICINGGSFSITGGTINGNATNKGDGFDHFQQGIEIRGGSGTIEGVTVKGLGSNVGFPGIGIVSWSSGNVTVKNVDINVNGIGIEADYNTVTVTGDDTVVKATDKALFVEDGGKLIVNAGTYTGSVAVDNVEGSAIEISDGRYSEYVDSKYVVEGKLCTTVKQDDDYFHIVNAVKVTFVTEDGITAPEAQTIPAGEKAVKPADPQKANYNFLGWFADGATEAFDFDTAITADTTLTAKWDIVTHTVTFESNGGSDVEAQTVEHGDKATKPADPTKDGAIFAGWTLNGEAYNFTTPVTGDITLAANWTEAVAKIGDTLYATLKDAVNAAEAGDTIELLKDVNENLVISGGKDFTLDLGGHTMTGYLDQYDANVTIENGTVAGTIHANGLASGKSGKLTIAADATVEADYAIILWQADDNTGNGQTIDINGTVNGIVWVMGNITEGNSVINVNDGAKITGDDVGIALNGVATVNVKEGATVTGTATGIEVRAGELNVTGGTITGGNGATETNPNGSGTTTSGAGIAVAQHTTKLDIKVTVSGGTITGATALNIANPEGNSEGTITVAVTGGIFNGPVTVADNETRVAKFVSGGDFSETVKPEYVVDGKLCTTTLTETINGNDYYYIVDAFKVTFDADNGTEAVIVEVPKGETVARPENDPTKEGFVFLGWFDINNEYNFTKHVYEDLTLKAHWEENKFEITYEWSADNKTVTAKAVCTNNPAVEPIIETVNTTSAVKTPATCETVGTTTYTAEFENDLFETQTKNVDDIDALGHDWDEPTYVWADDYSTVTATRTCKNDPTHVETETVETTSAVKTAATCETKGITTYTATFTNAAFATQTKDVEDIDALGHDWNAPTYEWAADNSTVTATRTCKNDPTHVETETVTTTSAVKTEATCEAKGITTYTATFTNAAFTTQTKDVEDIDALGHDWNEPTYVWADDYSSVTATRTCKRDATHVETETVNTTSTVKTAATCETAGTTTYTATFTNTAFATQTKDVEVPALGHDYGTPTYTWSDDNKTVTATVVCQNDSTHTITETVNATFATVTAATCTDAGEGIWVAKFTNTMFTTQVKTVAIEATGHDWNEPTYVWADDNSTVTATRTCKHDASHVETETVETTSAVKTAATCEAKGITTYTATFTNPAFAAQTKDVEDIDALGHDWNAPTYEWAADNSSVTATRTCKHDSTHVETETVNTTSAVKTAATCEAKGTTTYTATFTNPAFTTQTKDVEDINAIGHDWNAPTYEWAADNSTVTATRTCKHDSTHIETVTVNTTYAVITAATADTDGLGRYTATFEAPYATQTKDVVIPKLAQYVVTVTSSGDGTAVPGGITVAHVTGGGRYALGEKVTISAPAVTGYTFLGWYEVNGETPLSTDLTFEYTVREEGNDLIAVYEPAQGSMFRLTVTGSRFTIDNGTTQRSRFDDYYTPGSVVTLKYTGTDKFLYWINDAKKIVSTDPEYTFTMVADTILDAVYSEVETGETKEALVVFVSAKNYGQVISQRYYTNTESIVFPAAPVMMGKTFVKWDKSQEDIIALMETETRIVVYPVYESNAGEYIVSIEYWVGDTYYDIEQKDPKAVGSGISLSVDGTYEGAAFSYWMDEDGNILSYNADKYRIYPTKDITLRAVYGVACEAEPIVRMTDAYASKENNKNVLNFVATRAIPEGYTLESAGILFAGLDRISLAEAKDKLTLSYYGSTENAYVSNAPFVGKELDDAGFLYFSTSRTERQFIARAYIVVKDASGEIHYVYSNNVIYASFNELNNGTFTSAEIE